MKSDIIIIGGGAAGMMAALGAAKRFETSPTGGTVTVLEKQQKIGRKIMVTGKGRCNFTNVKGWEEFSAHVRAGVQLLDPAWHSLTPEDVIALFKSNGMPSVVERGDRAFPVSHLSGDVVDALRRAATLAGVKIVSGCKVESIENVGRFFRLACTQTTVKEFRPRPEPGRRSAAPVRTETTTEQVNYACSRLIIATGGLSYPWTGSDGDGYRFAESLGIDHTDLFPSLTALVPAGYKDIIKESELHGHIERLNPLSDKGALFNGGNLDNVKLSLYIDGALSREEFGDIEFTDGGLEGPLGFAVSREAVKALIRGGKVSVSIDLKPAVELEKLNEDIHQRWEDVIHDPRSKGAPFRKLFRILLGKLMPWELTLAFLSDNPSVSVDSMASALKDWKMDIAGFVGYERAVVTAGGIGQSEVIPKTLESRRVDGLYFAGEVLDIDADTGGYNLQCAFSTGWLAGMSAAASL